MSDAVTECGVIVEATTLSSYFSGLPDRHQLGKVLKPLDDVLLLTLLAVLNGAGIFVDIARFDGKKLELLRWFRPFRDGTPSHDHLGDIFATLNAEQFQRGFVAGWWR